MTATLYRQSCITKNISEVVTEDNWKLLISEWLLNSDVPMLPLDNYIIVQGNIIAEFKLGTLDNGSRYLELLNHFNTEYIAEGVK